MGDFVKDSVAGEVGARAGVDFRFEGDVGLVVGAGGDAGHKGGDVDDDGRGGQGRLEHFLVHWHGDLGGSQHRRGGRRRAATDDHHRNRATAADGASAGRGADGYIQDVGIPHDVVKLRGLKAGASVEDGDDGGFRFGEAVAEPGGGGELRQPLRAVLRHPLEGQQGGQVQGAQPLSDGVGVQDGVEGVGGVDGDVDQILGGVEFAGALQPVGNPADAADAGSGGGRLLVGVVPVADGGQFVVGGAGGRRSGRWSRRGSGGHRARSGGHCDWRRRRRIRRGQRVVGSAGNGGIAGGAGGGDARQGGVNGGLELGVVGS